MTTYYQVVFPGDVRAYLLDAGYNAGYVLVPTGGTRGMSKSSAENAVERFYLRHAEYAPGLQEKFPATLVPIS